MSVARLSMPARLGPGRSDDSDQLFALFRRTGDRSARDELVSRFLPLARAVARRYVTTREPFEDLLQVANVGLLKAVERFDPGRGTVFSSFAVPTILGELKRYFRDFGWSVHVARDAQDLALKVEQAQRKLESRTGRPPSIAALAEYLELRLEDVEQGLETSRAHYASSLDAPRDTDEDGSATFADLLGEPDDGFRLVDTRMTISSLVAELPPLERRVLALRFGGELTQAEIGQRIGFSQMQVSRILRRALHQLHELSEDADDL